MEVFLAITHLFSNLTISLQTIAPSLQAAAREMDGAEFCRFTEEVRDHYAAGRFLELNALLEGRGVKPTMEGARQMIFARMRIFKERPPVGILGDLKTEAAKAMLVDPNRIDGIRFPEDSGSFSPEHYYSSLLYELRGVPWTKLKSQMEPSRWEDLLFDVERLLTQADGDLGDFRTRIQWRILAEEYHALGRREDVLKIYRNLENEATNDDTDVGTDRENWKLEELIKEEYLPLGYFDEAERLLETRYFPNAHGLFMALAKALIEAGQKERTRTLLTERLLPEALERMPHREEAESFDILFQTARLLLMADLKKEAARLLRPLTDIPLKAFLRDDWDNRDGFIVRQTKEILEALIKATAANEVESFLKETALPALRSEAPSYRSVTMALELADFANSDGISGQIIRELIQAFKIEDYAEHLPQTSEQWFYRMGWDAELLALTKARIRLMKDNRS